MSHFMCPVCGQEADEPKTIDRSVEATLRAEVDRLSEEVDKKNKALADEATRIWNEKGKENQQLRAEAVRLREAAERALSLANSYEEALERTLGGTPTDVGNGGAAHRAIQELFSSTPATQREVERVRAMERVVESLKADMEDENEPTRVSTKTHYALAAYEQLVAP